MTERQKNKNIYWAWKAMKQRCLNPRCKAYRNYGARGITVCEEWKQFEPFCEWALKNGYQKGLEIDRINNDGNYEPSNCRWTTRSENINNRRCTHYISIDGVKKSIAQWAKLAGIDDELIGSWLKEHGEDYSIERIKEIFKNGYKKGIMAEIIVKK